MLTALHMSAFDLKRTFIAALATPANPQRHMESFRRRHAVNLMSWRCLLLALSGRSALVDECMLKADMPIALRKVCS